MTIKVYPEDLVRLGVWDSYSYYIVGSEIKAEKQLTENEEFEIQDTDALVIGLTKVIETNNLIHRLNGYITDFLTNKSSKMQGHILIRKKSIIQAFEKFRNKYPEYWKAPIDYELGLVELDDYIKKTLERVETLDVHKITVQFGTFEYLNSNQIKKLLKFNYQ